MNARSKTLPAFSECPDREGLLSLPTYTEHREFAFTTSASVNHQVWFKQSCDEPRASLSRFSAILTATSCVVQRLQRMLSPSWPYSSKAGATCQPADRRLVIPSAQNNPPWPQAAKPWCTFPGQGPPQPQLPGSAGGDGSDTGYGYALQALGQGLGAGEVGQVGDGRGTGENHHVGGRFIQDLSPSGLSVVRGGGSIGFDHLDPGALALAVAGAAPPGPPGPWAAIPACP